jgi:predicted CXXCH cytochrome family protein
MQRSLSAGARSRPARAGRPALFLSLFVGLLAFGAVYKWRADRTTATPTELSEPTDPRLTSPTPYRNVHPDVKYVGDDACIHCHTDQAETYHLHPMGQSFATVAAATRIEKYGPDAQNPFATGNLHYGITLRDNRPFHREWAADSQGKVHAEAEVEVHFAVGSGARLRNYAIDRDGYLFVSPITWYPEAGRWDLSPGFDKHNDHYSRPMPPLCVFCHASYAEHVPDTVNRYRVPVFRGNCAIGCERCHGPGELHVRRREGGDMAAGSDDTIVNPKRLGHELREGVCLQCHLQGEERVLCRGRSDFEYRPGLPLHLFYLDYVDGRPGGAGLKLVSAVPQLKSSRCYTASREPNKLWCVSCHDPHQKPAPEARVAHYRERCLRCHGEDSCSLPVQVRLKKEKEDSCIACHMPRTNTEVTHASVTDHRIRRSADEPILSAALRPTPAPSDLVPFHLGRVDPDDEEILRGLGLAIMGMLNRRMPEYVARHFAEQALPLLDRALAKDRRDWPVWKARVEALTHLGRQEEALAAAETVLDSNPESEIVLQGAGFLALEMNRPAAALSYFERAVRVNPWNRKYHLGLAIASFRQLDWDRSARACRQALRLEPSNSASHSLLLQCYLCLGLKEQAQAEFETLRQLTSEGRRPALRLWYEEQVRRFAR